MHSWPLFLHILNRCAKKMNENLLEWKKSSTFAPANEGKPQIYIAEWSSW